MSSTAKAALAEGVATFTFVTVGAGTVVMAGASRGQIALLGVAFAHGIALSVVVTVFGRISGGHVNPAVTVGVWLGGRIRTLRAAAYVVAQLAGAAAAGFLLRAIFLREQWEGSHLGTPALGVGMTTSKAILVEAVLTFFLLLAVWGTGVDPWGPKVGGFAIGLTVFADILFGGLLTGAAMNPARWFGPAVAAGFFDHWYVWWIGPLAGAAVASLLYRGAFWGEAAPVEVEPAAGAPRPERTEPTAPQPPGG